MISVYTGEEIEDKAESIASLLRQIHGDAIARQSTVRLVVELQEEASAYWVESTSSEALLAKDVDISRLGIREREEYEADLAKRNQLFSKDSSFLRDPEIMDRGIWVKWVKVGNQYYGEGKPSITFFRNGRTQASQIKLIDQGQNGYLVLVNPFSGKVEIKPTPFEDEVKI